MINVTSAFKNEVFANDNRNYQYDIRITFADNTYIDLSNEDLMTQGGVVIDEAVSSENTLSVGSCIVNKLTLTLQNFNGEYDAYDFIKANVVLKVGLLVNENLEKFQRGVYIVSEPPTYNTSCVTLVCYDYMSLLDIPYSSVSTVYPATISTIINDICTACNIQRETQELPHDSLSFSANPFSDVTTCREALSYIAQINCRNCRMTPLGKLEFVWFSDGFTGSSAIARKTQEDAVRSVENNVVRVTYYQSSGEVSWLNQVEIPAIYSLDMAKQNTVVTGVRIVIPAVEDDELGTIDTYETGTSDYLISVESNPLTNASNADSILATLASLLLGFRYRKATISHLGMPWMMAGDSGVVADSTGARRNIIISTTTFTSLDRQSTRSAGADNVVSTASRYSPETTQIVKTMDSIKPVIQTLNQRIANANGLYETQQTTQGGATITYMHNKPLLAESDIQIMISDVGVMVTANGTDPTPTWYGLEVNGNLIANILSANGINADWINTGALVIYDNNNNEIFRADKTEKIFRWNMTHSQLTDTGDLTLRDTEEVYDEDPEGFPAFKSIKQEVVHDSTNATYKVIDRKTNIDYGKIIALEQVEKFYTTESNYSQGRTGAEQVYVGEISPIDGIYAWNSKETSINHLNFAQGSSDGEAYLMLHNRYIEPFWANGYQNVISSNTNVNNYVRPGTYVCANKATAETLTNSPFTDSGFQMNVYQWSTTSSSNERMQIAWQNSLTSALKYRIRGSAGSWGSWIILDTTTHTSNTYAKKGAITLTINTTNFTSVRQMTVRSGRIVQIMAVLTTARALSAKTMYEVGTLSVGSSITCSLFGIAGSGSAGTMSVINSYVTDTNLRLYSNTALASGTPVEISGTYICADW